MRVIAGKYRHRLLKEIKNEYTRPTTDRNKETMFNVLGQFFDGGVGIDAFSGTGSLGIEAISRGLDKCYFIDKNDIAFDTLTSNIKSLDIKNAIAIKTDFLVFLNNTKEKFDLVLLDPPYPICEIINDILIKLIDLNLLKNGAKIVCETEKNITPVIPDSYEIFKVVIQASSKFTFLKYGG